MKIDPIVEQPSQLDDNVIAFLKNFSAVQASMDHLPIPEQRRKIKSLFLFPKDQLEPVESVEDIAISGRHGQIPLRIITPKRSDDKPIIVFFHRGGWVYGSNDESENICRKIANRSGCSLVQVEYRLSPEHRFPVPLEDCYDAVKWVASHMGKEKPIIVCGESAGGNLAAAVSIMAQREKGPMIAGQVLIYPALTNTFIMERYERSPDKYLLSYENMKWFWEQYLTRQEEGDDPFASPLKAQGFKGLPRTLIMTAEHDALRQEAKEYGEKLKQDGVEVVYKDYLNVIHGFLDLPLESPEIKRALDDLRVFINTPQ